MRIRPSKHRARLGRLKTPGARLSPPQLARHKLSRPIAAKIGKEAPQQEAKRRPRPGRTDTDLALEAARAALDDAGLEAGAIDGMFTGHTVVEYHLDFSAIVAQELGLRPRISGAVSRSGTKGTSLVVSAGMALNAGACDTVLALWADNRASAANVHVASAFAGLFTPYEIAYGPLIATHCALIANRHRGNEMHMNDESLASTFFGGCAEGRFLLQQCRKQQHLQYPPGPV